MDAGRGILIVMDSLYDIRPKWHEIGNGLKEFWNVDTLFTHRFDTQAKFKTFAKSNITTFLKFAIAIIITK